MIKGIIIAKSIIYSIIWWINKNQLNLPLLMLSPIDHA